MSSETVGDGKGRAPERRAEGNDDHGNQNENECVAQRNPVQRRLDEQGECQPRLTHFARRRKPRSAKRKAPASGPAAWQ